MIPTLPHWGFISLRATWLTLTSSKWGRYLWPVIKSSGTISLNVLYINNIDSCRCSNACDRPHRSWRSAVYRNATWFIPQLNRTGYLQSGAPLPGNRRRSSNTRRRGTVGVDSFVAQVGYRLFDSSFSLDKTVVLSLCSEQYLLCLHSPPTTTKLCFKKALLWLNLRCDLPHSS